MRDIHIILWTSFISVIKGCQNEIEGNSHAEIEPSGILILQKFNKLIKHAYVFFHFISFSSSNLNCVK